MDNVIEIVVRNRIAKSLNQNKIEYICENGDYTLVFDFDEEWTAHNTKTATFTYGGVSEDIVFTENQVNVPRIENVSKFEVGVSSDGIATTNATILARKSTLSGKPRPAAPSLDVYNQIIALINKGVASAEQIEKAVQDYLEQNPPQGVSDEYIRKVTEAMLEEAKESGEFDGAPGKDGKDGADGQPGKDGKDGKDYILTEADKLEIAGKVEVPGGGNTVTDDHINSLIDAKLGVVENGTY